MRCLKTIAVLWLLALWVPATSHTMLEQAGLIHTADAQHDDDHDAADGLCVNATTHVQAAQPSLGASLAPMVELEFWLAASAVIDRSVLEADGPAPPGVNERGDRSAGAGQSRSVNESSDSGSNVDDWEAIGRVWDGHRTARPGVLGNGEGAVIGREIELGLHDGGQRQQQ